MENDRLLEAFQCGSMLLQSRAVLAPVMTGTEFQPSLQSLEYFLTERARTGLGLVTVAAGVVHVSGKRYPQERTFDADLDVPRHTALTRTLHLYGARAVLQLNHAGLDTCTPIALTSSRGPRGRHSLGTISAPNFLLRHLTSCYARTAKLAAQSGYNGVEINAGGLSLPALMTTPAINTRPDAWGRSQLARFSFAIGIVRAIRKAVGDELLIGYRMNLLELTEKGASWSETTRFLQMLRMAGVNYIAPHFDLFSNRLPQASSLEPAGIWIPLYEELLKICPIPVIYPVTRESHAELTALAQRWPSVLFEFASTLTAHPNWLLDHAQPQACLSCRNCRRPPKEMQLLRCPVNPFLFHSRDAVLARVETPRNVLVIGAGLAGLSAACFIAQKGHRVRILEASGTPGGQALLASKIPGKSEYKKFVDYLLKNLADLNVTISTNKLFTYQQVDEFPDVDVFVVATGSEPTLPAIPGIDSSNVLTYEEALSPERGIGHRVAVLGQSSLARALSRYLLSYPGNGFLSSESPERWRQCWGIGAPTRHRAGVVGVIPQIEPPVRDVYLVSDQSLTEQEEISNEWQLLRIHGLQTFFNVNYESIDNFSLRISYGSQRKDGTVLRIDHLVVCLGAAARKDVEILLNNRGKKVLTVGACSSSTGYQAIDEIVDNALKTALKIE